MAKREKVDLFGPVERTPRGWTELDRIRSRYNRLTKKVAEGEANEKEMEEASRLRVKIDEREKEARAKWAKSFRS
jgi:hypothetical protein